MNRKQLIRLRELCRALFEHLESLEWLVEHDDDDLPDEIDDDFDYLEGRPTAVLIEPTFIDESDSVPWPICVECGNFTPSCVC